MRLEPYWQQARRHVSRTFLGYACFMLVTFLVVNGAALGIYALWPGIELPAWGQFLLSMGSMYAVALPVSLLIWRRCRARAPEKHRMRLYQLGLSLVMAVSLLYLGSWAGMALASALEAITGAQAGNAVSDLLGESSLWSSLLFAVLIGPACEELVFRKLLIDRMRVFGDRTAIWASGLAFGLFHGNLYQFFYAAAIGMLLAFLYCRTGRLRYPIAIHMLVNSISAFFLPLLLARLSPAAMELMENLSPEDPAFSEQVSAYAGELTPYFCAVFAILLAVGAGLVLLIANRNRFWCQPGEVTLPRGRRARVLVLNLGVALFVLLCIAEIVMTFFA